MLVAGRPVRIASHDVSLGSSFRGVVVALALGALSAAACFDSGDRPDKAPPPPPGPVEVDLTQAYQRIDGFGASSAWTAGNISDALADQFFSPELGIGLSLLRVQIKPAGNTAELGTARKAAARGAKVWARAVVAARRVEGQRLDDQRRLAAGRAPRRTGRTGSRRSPARWPRRGFRWWRSRRRTSRTTQATWDTCIYTPAQLVTFVRDFLGPALAAQSLTVPVMAPETQGWDQFERFADPLMRRSRDGGDARPDRDAPLRRLALRLRARRTRRARCCGRRRCPTTRSSRRWT